MEEEYVMSFGLCFLKVIGFNPINPGIFDHIRALILILTTLSLYCLNILPMIIEYDGIQSLEDSIDSIPAGHQVMVKLVVAMVLRNKIKHLYEMVNQKWPDNIYGNELQRRIRIQAKSFKNVFSLCRAIFLFSSVAYSCKPLLVRARVLATQLYTPCDLLSNTCYITFLVVQNVYTIILSIGLIFFYFIFHAFLFFAYTELEKIKYGFRHLGAMETKEFSDRNIYKEFCKIIRHHSFILKFLYNLNDVYSLQLFNQFITLGANVVLAILFMNKDGFPPSYDNLIRYIMYLVAILSQLFFYCLAGEGIYSQLASVSDAVFESNWYTQKQSRITKAMVLIIQVSHVNKKLTIGNTWTLNLATFMSVLKTSFSLQACLQTAYK